jgi:hypothetical protein
LEDLCATKGNVELTLESGLLTQWEARNAGLRRSHERYCAILENDTLVHENWLQPLLECMTAETAAVVTPMVWWYRGLHTAGCAIQWRERNGKIELSHTILYDDVRRKPIDYPESHCILIDRDLMTGCDIFGDVEPFDVDFGLQLRARGLPIFFEPGSEVTYSAPPPLEVRDLELYKFRWSTDNWKDSNVRFAKKWAVSYDQAAKRSSYRRQQAKLGLARWYPANLTVSIANLIFILANYIQSSVGRFSNR